MTTDQIIQEIWSLKWYQVIKVALYDDFILMCKIWPLYIVLIILYIFIVTSFKNKCQN